MSRVICTFLATLAFACAALASDISQFVGDFSGSAEMVQADGSKQSRDMSVSIRETREGFLVEWTSVSYRDDGRTKSKTYEIEFVPSGRGTVFAAAMRRNVFGHSEPLDPMQGEPYVWARLDGDTLTVFSLFVAEDGGYEIQQFDRTLVSEGLELNFERFRNGEKQRSVQTILKRD